MMQMLVIAMCAKRVASIVMYLNCKNTDATLRNIVFVCRLKKKKPIEEVVVVKFCVKKFDNQQRITFW